MEGEGRGRWSLEEKRYSLTKGLFFLFFSLVGAKKSVFVEENNEKYL